MRKLPDKRSPPKRRAPKLAPEPKKKKKKGSIADRWEKCTVMNDKGVWNRTGWVCPLSEADAYYVDEAKSKEVNRPVGYYRQVYVMDHGFTILNEERISVAGTTLDRFRQRDFDSVKATAPLKRIKLPPKRKAPPKRKKAPPKRKR